MAARQRLLIPVEIKTRELDAKLLFSCFAVERGYEVLIGQRQALYRDVLPVSRPGILIEHDVTAAHKATFPNIIRLGHNIVAWDEEVLAQPSGTWYAARRISSEVIQHTSAHFAWGREQKQWIEDVCPHFVQRVFATGNPRFDLLRPEFSGFYSREADQYRNRYGGYILINSNFSRANLFHGNRANFIDSVGKSAGLSAELTSYYGDFITHSENTFRAYVDMLPVFSARFPDRQIIVRPHPAENLEPWVRAASGLKNVHVLYEGTANGWIAGAAVLLHSGCTTAVEAAVLGTPSIEFSPVHGPEFVLSLPRVVSLLTESLDELFGQLEAVLADGPERVRIVEHAKQQLQPYVSGLEGAFASDAILDRISRLGAAGGSRFYRIQKRAQHLLRPLHGKAKNSESSGVRYAKHKFPDTSPLEVEEAITTFRRVSGRFEAVSVFGLGNNCFRLQPA
jgi:surface carbohydrate biosynthesis protein